MPDPLLILPTELASKVFSYLPYHDIWRLRHLSKPYNKFLRDEELELAAVTRYETPDDSAGLPPTLAGRIALMKAHHTGMPVALLKIPATPVLSANSPASPALKGRFLAYLATRFDLTIVDLSTGNWHIITMTFDITMLTITTKLLVWATSSHVCYQSLSELKHGYKFRPVGQIEAIAAHEDKFAVLHVASSGFVLSLFDALGGHRRLGRFQSQQTPGLHFSMVLTLDSCLLTRARRISISTGPVPQYQEMVTCIDLATERVDRARSIERIVNGPISAVWKDCHYGSTFESRPMISIVKLRGGVIVRRARLIHPSPEVQARRSVVLVNESFLVDLPLGGRSLYVYTFDTTATACEVEPILWRTREEGNYTVSSGCIASEDLIRAGKRKREDSPSETKS